MLKILLNWIFRHRLIQRSEQLQKSNFFLSGNFAPVIAELDCDNLTIEGELPHDLVGVYMRNGPNPAFPPFSYTYPFDGDGMIHAIYLENGKARYKNRFVQTPQLIVEQRIGKAMYGGVNCPYIRDSKLLLPDEPKIPIKIGRFIHIIRHANHLIALHEAESAYEINRELKTLGEWNPTSAKEAISVNAHTRLDPETGELFFIAYHLDKPVIDYHVMDKNGGMNQSGFIDVPYSCMVHDFVLTKNYLIIFLCPVVVSIEALMAGKGLGEWKPKLNTRIAVLSRKQLSQNVIWSETEAFFTYHFANAYEYNNEIIIDHVRYPEFTAFTENSKPAHLYQTIIDIAQKKCRHIQKDDRNIEFPRINDQVNSKEYRYIYSAANLRNQKTSNDIFNALIKYDIKTGASDVHDFGSHYEIGEAVFAPKINSIAEDDGYLLFFIYNKIENVSSFVILDAQRINEKPLAIVKLPCRVPSGLHGSWMYTLHA
jgi:carotenoid cleavage dioxygenase-like enzyme